MFDVYYIGQNKRLKELVPFAKRVESSDEIKAKTKMYWVVDPNTEILDLDILKYRPPDYDQIFEHVWKVDPKNYGGVRLVPSSGYSQGVKQINHVVCQRRYDILQSKDPGDYFDNNKTSDHVWVVDPEYTLNSDINWSPDLYEPDFIHSFHLRDQLEHKYPFEEGGIKLFPRNWKECEVKYHDFLDSLVVKYPFLYVDDVNDHAQRDMYTDSFVWLIDKEHQIDEDSLEWTPNQFEQEYVHCFRMPNQLRDKYPAAMGGIKLVPKDWEYATDKIHGDCPVKDIEYDVFFTNKKFTIDTMEFYAARSLTDWFWVVDWDYDFNGRLTYIPEKHEQDYIHVFKWGLEWRYQEDIYDLWDDRVAGIYLVHKDFDFSKKKLHTSYCPVKYDIFYTNDLNNYLVPSRKSRTDMFWLVDEDHILSNNFTYAPSGYDQRFIHIFKIPGQLEYKYDPEITSVSDNRAGGVKLIPKNYAEAEKKFINKYPLGVVSLRTQIVNHEDLLKYENYAENLIIWAVDQDYFFQTDLITWEPPYAQRNYIHIFHIPDQIPNKDRYELGKSGGIVRLPATSMADRLTAKVVVHTESPLQKQDVTFSTFHKIEDGLMYSETEWFWVIDPTVIIDEKFSYNFIPDPWDKEKIHVWQKLNPKTGRQYDYGGVQLVPKGFDLYDSKARPKYIREIASTQKEFPVYYVDPEVNLLTQLAEFDTNTENTNFWVVSPHVEVSPDFDFDYYPTQWDMDNVHVFQDQAGNYRNVYLYPKDTFNKDSVLTEEDILNNSFPKVKFMQSIASLRVSWPVVHMKQYSKDQFLDKIDEYKGMGYAYVWSVDSDVTSNNDLLEASYQPALDAVEKVHIWQKTSPDREKIHSYGGLRLWPTNRDYTTLTSAQLKLNKMKGLQYVREIGSYLNPLDIVLISHNDLNASKKFSTMRKKHKNIKWVKDIDGIFEAHKEAAKVATTEMFYVVDSDCEVVEDFAFDFVPDMYDLETTHVWKANNPVTGDAYGWGGIKLFNRQLILDADNWGLDFTTGLSKSFKYVDQVSNVSRFNTDELSSWRSAFREAAKLTLKSLKGDEESSKRLEKWLAPDNEEAAYYDFVLDGAIKGHEYAEKHNQKPLRLTRINDYEWLSNQFALYKEEIAK